MQSAYQEELQRLEKTAAEIEHQLKTLQQIPRYYGDDFTEQALDNIREMKRNSLPIAVAEPYFGRLDFQEEGHAKPTPLYIGKAGVEDDRTNELLVIDWRAPVASLFYTFTGGEDAVSYESPDGIIDGLVFLKRNLVIRQQILQRVVESYVKGSDNLGVTDEFLLYRLEENKDNRLRDIVSTIQEEQDSIIRSVKNQALIIQGVAGSGKTTVALHRLAYLLYRYRENINSEKMIIFAPNSMFLDYISSVLPELGVGGIQQTTFSDWALNTLEDRVKLTDPSIRLSHWFSLDSKHPVVDDEVPGRFKGSIAFMQLLDQVLISYEECYVPSGDFVPWDGVVLSNDLVRTWFYHENKHYPLAKRRERVIARIKRWIEMELDKVWETKVQKELKKKAGQRLRSFMKTWPDHTPYTFYQLLFNNKKSQAFIPPNVISTIPESIIESSMKRFNKHEVELEDLSPLLFIHRRLYGKDSNDYFDHVVIDEAQDFSPFQVALLKEQTRGNSFTILGDLSQGIHSYQGIRSWDEFASMFEAGETAYYELVRSYRSTMEIIQFANEILDRSGETVTLAKPVFRSGDPVHVLNVSEKNRISAIIKAVQELQKSEWNTIAVIGRTADECRQIFTEIHKAGLSATIIDANQREYQGGLSVLPVYLAKGLEFDAVLLVDVDAEHYKLNADDAKLLYVGCTRALHQLSIHYAGEISPLIDGITTS
ncbi:MAG: 3'-5' exonuclease [Bacilli bacterium]